MNMSELVDVFTSAITQQSNFIAVSVETAGCGGSEIIVNPGVNFSSKLAYYSKAYNDDLTLRAAPDAVKIVAIAVGDSFEELERALLGC